MKRAGLFGPLMEITRLQTELNRLFAGILESQRTSLATAAAWDPNVDVLESAREIEIVVEVPGLSAGDLTAAAKGSRLQIRGVKRADRRPGNQTRFLCMERFFGDFEKIVSLPNAVNLKQAKARLSDGLLRIRIPRVLSDRRKSLDIKIEIQEGTP
ncbi:MAG: Hsp20/alpha crystallin family protein [Thermoanaerobaculia bacterium]